MFTFSLFTDILAENTQKFITVGPGTYEEWASYVDRINGT
jgi:hypothetical protein